MVGWFSIHYGRAVKFAKTRLSWPADRWWVGARSRIVMKKKADGRLKQAETWRGAPAMCCKHPVRIGGVTLPLTPITAAMGVDPS